MLGVAYLCAGYLLATLPAPFSHYEIYVDYEVYATLFPITGSVAEVCVDDDEPHVVTFWAVDEDDSRQEVTGATLPRVIQADAPRAPLDNACRADFDNDGRVGIDDFGTFVAVFNTGCEW